MSADRALSAAPRDDTLDPLHQARVDALSARAQAARNFRRALEIDIGFGVRSLDQVVDLLGQLVAEVTSRILDAAAAGEAHEGILTGAAVQAALYDSLSRTNPKAWALRRGGPGLPEVADRNPTIATGKPELIDPEAGALQDAIRDLARRAIADARRRHVEVDSTSIAAAVRAAVRDELAAGTCLATAQPPPPDRPPALASGP